LASACPSKSPEDGELYYALHDQLRQAIQVDGIDASDEEDMVGLLDKKITSWCQNYELSEWSDAVRNHNKHSNRSQKSASTSMSQVEEGSNVVTSALTFVAILT